jgi:hypothetical protein
VQGTTHGYVYDPGTSSWSAIPLLPIDLWGMAYSVSGGQLLVSGGVTAGGEAITNRGFAYTPGTGWSALPDSSDAVYRAGSGCGLYEVGGYDTNNTPTASTQVLPGYDDCASGSNVSWLSVKSPVTTVAPGKSVTVAASLSARTATQPGTYTASLVLVNSTPHQVTGDPVAVTLTVTPPAAWGEIAGSVTGLACNGTSTPLAGATVEVTGKTSSWTLTTESSGQYALWASQAQDPLTVIAQAASWLPQTAKVKIIARKVATAGFTLTPSGGCGSSGGRHA